MSEIMKPFIRTALVALVAIGFVVVAFGLTIAQEEPAGAVAGVVLDEHGRPLAGANVYISREDHPSRSGVTNQEGRFLIIDVPAGAYTGYVTARGYEWFSLPPPSKKPIEVSEGRTTTVGTVKLVPRPPSVYGHISPVFIPGEAVRFPLRGYSRLPIARVDIAVYRYDFARRTRETGGRPEPYSDSLSRWSGLGDPVHERRIEVRTDNEGYFARDLTLPIKDVGGYLIHVRLESTEALFKTLITDLALVVKRATGNTLVFAASFTKRRPVAGARVEFYGADGLLSAGETDRDGLLSVSSLPQEAVTVLGSLGDSHAVNSTYAGDIDEAFKCYIYTDRPVYRPGHRVQFKGIMRASEPGRYKPVAGKPVPVAITDPNGAEVAKLSLSTDGFGSFHGAAELDEHAEPGYYSVTADYGGTQHYASFKVEEYRKPEFKATVSFDRRHYVGGQTIRATVNAAYYFGAPVSGGKVAYRVYKSPDYFYYYPDEESDISFFDELMEYDDGDGYYYGYGELVTEGEAVADENGIARLSIPTKRARGEERYELEVAVSDPGGRSVDASGGVLVTPAAFTFSLDTDRYFYKPGQRVTAAIYAVDYDGKRQSDVEARITLTPERVPKGEMRKPVLSRSVKLGKDGAGKLTFTIPKDGYYVLRAEAPDRRGRTARGETWIWAASDDWTGEGYDPASLEVAVDRKLYKAGDTARVMINSPEKDCWVLFTIEGRRLFDRRVIHIESGSAVLEVPIPADFTPNVFACASLIKGKKFVSTAKPVLVSPAGSFLTVKVEPDRTRYEPGDQATYTLTTLDAAGRGVPAQVSLGVVDESVYAIREDRTPDIRRFFHGPNWNRVNTSVSFSDFYYGGVDKFEGKVRRYFPDTAYWNPVIATDSNGRASVSFKLPDNLTTWRATARAVTLDTAVGGSINKVIVTKNLLVRLQTPRVFRQRDSLTLSAVVHNYTEREQSVRVWLEAEGIEVRESGARTLKLGPGSAGRMEWSASAPDPGTARITVYAQGQGDQDAMEMETPILPHGVPRYESASGQADGTVSLNLKADTDIIREASVLEMGFSPSIAGAALGLVDALERYPTESAEGIMDILLPNIVVYQAMKQAGIESPERLARIKKMVERDLRTVYRWQLPGGGWGWWEYGGKDPWMTAYVVYGLVRARQAGLPVNAEVLRKGIEAARISLPDAGDLGKQATMIYALTLAGQGRIQWINQVLADKNLQNYSLSLMILSLHEMGQHARARQLVPKLEAGAVESRLHCSWPETFTWGFYSCNSFETTAYAVRALLAADPDNPRIPKAIRWLVDRRKGARYEGNYDTAAVVYALADYLMIHRPVEPNYTARVYVNDQLVETLTMDSGSIYQPETKVVVSGDVIRPGANTIRIERGGSGDLFYWAMLKHYSSAEDLKALRGKVSIERTYHTLKLVRDPKEGLVYRPTPLRGAARVGDLIRCRLVVQSPKNFQYLVVEDPLPSGCEVARRPRDSYDYWGAWDYWWSGETVRDDRVSFFLGTVYEGKRVIEYDFRPEMKGSFHVMPATAQGYFEPDIFAHSSERRLVVR